MLHKCGGVDWICVTCMGFATNSINKKKRKSENDNEMEKRQCVYVIVFCIMIMTPTIKLLLQF